MHFVTLSLRPKLFDQLPPCQLKPSMRLTGDPLTEDRKERLMITRDVLSSTIE